MSDMIKILAASASQEFGERVAAAYGTNLVPVRTQKFSDGEFTVSIEETVRGKEVIIVQSTFPPSDNLLELLMLIDAAKRASAKRIVAVMPYFGFARQDRKDKPRVAIGAKLVANMLMAAGVNRVITMDLHADQIQGFFEVPVDHLFGSTLFLPWIETHISKENLCIATPDTGGTKRASTYAKHLGVDMAICYKQRKVANQVENMTVIGDVNGKNVVIVDDMCDTAGNAHQSGGPDDGTRRIERPRHLHPPRFERPCLRAHRRKQLARAHRHRLHPVAHGRGHFENHRASRARHVCPNTAVFDAQRIDQYSIHSSIIFHHENSIIERLSA